MVVSSDAFSTVRDLLVRQTGVRAEAVTAEARLVEDLGIDGDDLVEVMDTFFDELMVDAGQYSHKDYAGAEGFSLFGKGERRRPLPISALVAALERGRWEE